MKAIVVYSSQTGNTKKLAETVCKGLPTGTQMCMVDDAPDPTDYDLVALGFWIQAGKPDPKSASYLTLHNGTEEGVIMKSRALHICDQKGGVGKPAFAFNLAQLIFSKSICRRQCT